MKTLFKFENSSNIRIFETKEDSMVISGTMLVAGISTNNRLYEVSELENIAKNMVNKPVYHGLKRVIENGKARTVHDDNPENRVGTVIKTFLNRKLGRIRFLAEIWNTRKYPNLINEVRSGWGVSVGGRVKNAEFIRDKVKGLVMRIKNMIVEHLALVKPSISTGFKSAKVEKIGEVTMSFTNFKGKPLSAQKIALLVYALSEKGVI